MPSRKGFGYKDAQGICANEDCRKPFLKKGRAIYCIDCREKRRIEQHKAHMAKKNKKDEQ